MAPANPAAPSPAQTSAEPVPPRLLIDAAEVAPALDEAPALRQEHRPDRASGGTPPDEAQARYQPARQCATKKTSEDNRVFLGESLAQGVQWQALCSKYQQAIGLNTVERLAGVWGVSAEALRRLGIGFDTGAYTFPMMNARGEIIGIRKRAYDNPTQKYAATDSTNGLFIPATKTPSRHPSLKSSSCLQVSSWGRAGASTDSAQARGQGALGLRAASVEVICEGESDLAAALTLGFEGIGRPGTWEARKEIVAFFGGCLTACPCITADNDPHLAGQEGAEALADELVAAGLPCRVLTPPADFKDLRDWLTRGHLTTAALRAAIDRRPIRWPDDDAPGFVQVPNRGLRRALTAQIGAGPFSLACVLLSFYRPGGEVYPPREVLASRLGVTVGTVDRWKRVLEKHGIVEWRRGGTGRANVYRVNFGPWRKSKKRERDV